MSPRGRQWWGVGGGPVVIHHDLRTRNRSVPSAAKRGTLELPGSTTLTLPQSGTGNGIGPRVLRSGMRESPGPEVVRVPFLGHDDRPTLGRWHTALTPGPTHVSTVPALVPGPTHTRVRIHASHLCPQQPLLHTEVSHTHVPHPHNRTQSPCTHAHDHPYTLLTDGHLHRCQLSNLVLLP